MNIKATSALLALLLASAPLAAQPSFTDGSDPSAATEAMGVGDLSQVWIGQTFVARATTLSKVSFWFTQGVRSVPGWDYVNWFYFTKGAETYSEENNYEFMFYRTMRPKPAGFYGRRDIWFGTPLELVVGQTYNFGMAVSDCGISYSKANACAGGFGAPAGPIPNDGSMVDVTFEDAYDDGYMLYSEAETGGAIRDRDMRFVLTYGVPEPATLGLVLVALLGLVGTTLRHRRAGRGRL